jgi:hypothetical protein
VKVGFGKACYAVELGRPPLFDQHDGKAGGDVGASALFVSIDEHAHFQHAAFRIFSHFFS